MRFSAVAGVLLLAAAITAAVAVQSNARTSPLPQLGSVPSFTLIDSSGNSVTESVLLGRVTVLNLFFSNCDGPCPAVMSQVRELRHQISDPLVRFLSITVDPDRDTPAVLTSYAGQMQGESKISADLWMFATGPRSEILTLANKGLKMGIDPQVVNIHSTQIALIDSTGNIRGYYSPGDSEKLLSAVQLLRRQSSSEF